MLAKASAFRKLVTAHESATSVMWLSQDVLDGTILLSCHHIWQSYESFMYAADTSSQRSSSVLSSLWESKTNVLSLSLLMSKLEPANAMRCSTF